MRDVAVVIPAGGVGARVGARTPKQFLSLGDASILVTTVRHFVRRADVAGVVVAAPAQHVARTRRALARVVTRTSLTVVPGGVTRQESVALGLAAAPAAEIVVVHDAVRPFITDALVDRVVAAARDVGAAICALPVKETVKRVRDGLVEVTVDRTGLWSVQTPQAFRAGLLREAHATARRQAVTGTDCAMLVERLGGAVRVVEGLEANVKITTPGDLARARAGVRRGR
jgi:2-C-methyl-D-erythritol 4-phosphate cytidylyltransferase